MHPSEAERLTDALRAKGLRMSAAESCTGGLIGASITDMPGSSDVFLGSAVTYSNDAKESVLGVSHDSLLEYGAVSEQVAREMALGSIRAYDSDVAVAVTGIAGPGGATDTKPVGLVYIAVADGPRTVVTRNVFDGDRQSVRSQTVAAACSLLTDLVSGLL